MIMEDDVEVILEALAYSAKHAAYVSGQKRLWAVYYKVRDEFKVGDTPKKKPEPKMSRKARVLLYAIAVIGGLTSAYLFHKITALISKGGGF